MQTCLTCFSCILDSELQVRLRSGLKSNEGRVELFLNGTWGTICGNDWGIEDANVICRMMGFTRGAWGTHCCSWYSGLSAPDQIWLDRVGCVGDETSIAECRHGGWGSHNCDHSEDIGVVCKYTPPPTPGKIFQTCPQLVMVTEDLHCSIFRNNLRNKPLCQDYHQYDNYSDLFQENSSLRADVSYFLASHGKVTFPREARK